ncbi:MAG: hypothetical protein NC548_34800 [Lachnospiraceae bacterium]|nr:hypothetical protein [Lachnospiraceae bacterium]
MGRLIVFFAYEPLGKGGIHNGYYETKKAIETENGNVFTTQMSCLSMDLFAYHGFTEIHINQTPDDQIKLYYDIGSKKITCNRTEKELRLAHNLEKLWKANAFS